MTTLFRSLSESELKLAVAELRPFLVGAQIQEIWLSGDILVFECFHRGAFALAIDLEVQTPAVVLLTEDQLKFRETPPKPVVHFLKSHARGQRIYSVDQLEGEGRVLQIRIGVEEKSTDVRIELIPRSPNLFVREPGGKQISWDKPTSRAGHAATSGALQKIPAEKKEQEFSLELYSKQWLHARFAHSKKESAPKNKTDSLQRALEKKEKALRALEDSLNDGEQQRWRDLGNSLQQYMGQKPPIEIESQLDPKLNLQENMQKAFEKAKQIERKREGTRERIQILAQEITDLKKRIEQGEVSVETPQGSLQKSAKKRDELPNTRILKLESGATAYIGKSGADNLALLRQAKAWDYWVHLKDYPSAYGIIKRGKDQKIPQKEIGAVADWIFTQSKQGRGQQMGKYEVIVVECRHVRPIKGDKMGRVTYHHPQVFIFSSK